MPQSLAKILVHLVFSTKHRTPILPGEPFIELHKFVRGILDEQKSPLIEMNNMPDHVHLLFILHRTEALSNLVMHIKRGTSRWLKKQGPQYAAFDWQDGYGAFSVSPSNKDEVLNYIREQQIRHAHRTFQDEFREFLLRHEIEFDERYVWD